MRVELNLPDSLLKNTDSLKDEEKANEIRTKKLRLMAVEQLEWCKDVKFSKAPDHGSNNQVAPEWMFNTRAAGSTSKPKTPNSDRPQSDKCRNCENCENCKDQNERSGQWTWLGPASMALLGTVVLGAFGIVAARFQRNVVIQTDRDPTSLSSSDDTPQTSNVDVIELKDYE